MSTRPNFSLATSNIDATCSSLATSIWQNSACASVARDAHAEFCQIDVAREEQVASMFDVASEKFGRVDILVNNAGIQPLGVGFDSLTGELFRRTMDVNGAGVAFGIKHAAR